MLKISGSGLEKPARLNPYKRAKSGKEFDVTVGGETAKALIPPKGKYTYITVAGVEYYITGEMVEGGNYTVEDVQPAPKVAKEPKAPKEPKAAKEPRTAAV